MVKIILHSIIVFLTFSNTGEECIPFSLELNQPPMRSVKKAFENQSGWQLVLTQDIWVLFIAGLEDDK